MWYSSDSQIGAGPNPLPNTGEVPLRYLVSCVLIEASRLLQLYGLQVMDTIVPECKEGFHGP